MSSARASSRIDQNLTFCVPGSLFLWMFWPSFNSVLVDNDFPWRKLGAVCSTYLALAVSAVTASAMSMLSSPRGKLNPVFSRTLYVNTTFFSSTNSH